jgi:hypothetical protein
MSPRGHVDVVDRPDSAPVKLRPADPPRGPSSWILRRRSTGEAIAETFLAHVAAAINTDKYEAAPIDDYLGELNRKARAGTGQA